MQPTKVKRGANPKFVHLVSGMDKVSAGSIALVPGAQVAVLPLDLPHGLRGEAREQVARRQLRDLIGLGPDAVQLRPFHDLGNGDAWTRVLVVSPQDIAGWCAQAGEDCRAVLPDYLGLPTAPDVWTVTGTDAGIIARLGPQDGFSATPPVALALITTALAEANPKPRAILRLGPALPHIEALAEDAGIEVQTDPKHAGAQSLAHGELAFDLRRDPQAARARLRARVLPWRWPALAALLAAGIWATTQVLVIQRLTRQHDDLKAATMVLVRGHFLPSGPVLDIRTQVARVLADHRAATAPQTNAASAGPLDLLGRTSEVLANGKVQVHLANYTQEQGLTVQISLPDFAALDQLVATLDLAGLRVTVVQSRASDQGADAELRIAMGQP